MSEEPSGPVRRGYRSRAEADELAAEYESSGLTQREFGKRRGVRVKTLARYVKRFRQRAVEAEGRPRWLTVEMAESESGAIGSGLLVVLCGGRRIEVGRGFDAATLEQLVTVLERG